MTTSTIASLFVTLIILAVIPGPGTLIVVSRTLVSGFGHGLVTSLGIVCGDYVFIALSLLGLSVLAEHMGELFIFVQYAASFYLAALGLSLFFAKAQTLDVIREKKSSLIKDFSAGLVTTLGNPKAIVFYASFFPAFINVASYTLQEVLVVLLLVFFAVGGVMACYAFTASQSRKLFNSPKAIQKLNQIAGIIMLTSACWLALKA